MREKQRAIQINYARDNHNNNNNNPLNSIVVSLK